MDPADYIAGINKAYQEELGGEVFFGALAGAQDDSQRASKLRVLARLERQTAATLEPLLAKYGGAVEMDESVREQSLREAADYSAGSWEQFLLSMSAVLPPYVKTFKDLEAAAPRGELPALRALTQHEEALVEFVCRELNGQTVNSLEPVLALLARAPGKIS
jgi:hypothetical protein